MESKDLKRIVFFARYNLGDFVYLKVKPERDRGMVTGIFLRPAGYCYGVTFGDGCESTCWEIELSDTYVSDYQNEDSE